MCFPDYESFPATNCRVKIFAILQLQGEETFILGQVRTPMHVTTDLQMPFLMRQKQNIQPSGIIKSFFFLVGKEGEQVASLLHCHFRHLHLIKECFRLTSSSVLSLCFLLKCILGRDDGQRRCTPATKMKIYIEF